MLMRFLGVWTSVVIVLLGCRTTSDPAEVKDTEYIREIGEAPHSYPTQITLVRNLAMIDREGALPIDQIRYDDNDQILGVDDVVISTQDYWNFYFPSFPLVYGVAWDQHCAQLVENIAGTKIVMFHLAACPTDNSLLDASSLRFYLIVDESEYNTKRGLNGFVSQPLTHRGVLVGSMHKKVVEGNEIYYIGDLCNSRGSGDYAAPDETASAVVCDIQKMGQKIIALRLNDNRSGTPRALQLTGFKYLSDEATSLEQRICFQETVPNLACTAHGDRMSDGCYSVGLSLIPCRGCERMCEGKFPSGN